MITGATLPDAGEARVLRSTDVRHHDRRGVAEVAEQFGMVSNRTVLVEQLNVEQNLALPCRSSGGHVALVSGAGAVRWRRSFIFQRPSFHNRCSVHGSDQVRVRLGRALALDPRILLLGTSECHAVAGRYASVCRRLVPHHCRAAADVDLMTSDRTFASPWPTRSSLCSLQPAI
jgi:predicted ABC-type transport system involved in lysophospholipase L1 biosynthesis ATPase subunit